MCFLVGATVPLLLRPRPGPEMAHRRWLLVGETYVNDLAGASLDGEAAEESEALRSPEGGTPTTQALRSTPEPRKHRSFLDVLGLAQRDRSFAMMSNAKVDVDEWRPIYYSDLGKIEFRRAGTRRCPQAVVYPSGRQVAGETSRATIVGSGERMQLCID